MKLVVTPRPSTIIGAKPRLRTVNMQCSRLCSKDPGLPYSVLGDVSAPARHGLTSASLTDPVLQALLQGSTDCSLVTSV
ncbi:hypothetical protein R6Z07F_013695 [Ovis aries]